MTRQGTDQPRLRQIILDGIKYDIAVRSAAGGMFRAEWKCSECQEDGAWAPISADPKEAIRLAQVGLEVHHTFLHSGK